MMSKRPFHSLRHSQERENCHNDDDQTDHIYNAIHDIIFLVQKIESRPARDASLAPLNYSQLILRALF